MSKVIVFTSSRLNIRGGGPAGYVANLQFALGSVKERDGIEIVSRDAVENVKRIVRPFIFWSSKKREIIEDVKQQALLMLLYLKRPNVVICNSVEDFCLVEGFLKGKRKVVDIKIGLMSHSPIWPSEEKREMGGTTREVGQMKLLEDFAVRRADFIVTPSLHAMDAYISKNIEFRKIIKEKSIYVETGVQGLKMCDREEARKKFGIKTKYVLSFIGRHCESKGYDLLKIFGESLLRDREDVTILVAGKISERIQPLQHPRWIEVGWVDPAEVLSCTDIYLSMNKSSYFDLILLEVMSLGVFIVGKSVGGTIDISVKNPAMNLFCDEVSFRNVIDDYLCLNDAAKNELKMSSIKAYQDNFTLRKFAENYLSAFC